MTTAAVMISINVKSMLDNAIALREYLEKNGVKCWICVDIGGGAQYREEIVSAVKNCKVFLPLMNNAWANSGECYDEYSYAKRLNLTSHEKQITKPNQPRLPVIIPVAFPDLDWNVPHIELLASSTNFIVTNSDKLNNEKVFSQILQTVLLTLKAFDSNVQVLSPTPSNSSTASTVTTASDATVSMLVSPEKQLFSYVESLQATLNLIKPLQSKLLSQSNQSNKSNKSENFTFKKRYFGIYSETTNNSSKPEEPVAWKLTTFTIWSEEFEFTDVSNPNEIKGQIIWKKEHGYCTPSVSDPAFANLPSYISNWVKNIILTSIGIPQIEKFKGTFEEKFGVFIVKGYEVSSPKIAAGEYHLMVTDDGNGILGFFAGSNKQYNDPLRLKAF